MLPLTVQAPPQNFLPLFDRNGQRARTGRTLNLNPSQWMNHRFERIRQRFDPRHKQTGLRCFAHESLAKYIVGPL